MRYDDPTLGQKVLDVAQAQGEPMVRPDGVSDHRSRETVPFEAREIVEVQHPSPLPGFHGSINLTVPLRDLYDRYGFGLILLGMPGLEKKLARYPQLYSRIGFVHEFRPLREAEMQLVARQHAATFGIAFDPASLAAVEALAAVVRITRGNLRLAERLLAQMRRIMDLNGAQTVSTDIVDAARDRLVIGPGD